MYRAEGVALSDDEIRLTVPLTPSLNVVQGWLRSNNHRKFAAHRREQQTAVMACLRQIFGVKIPRPWAEHITIRVVRCSDTSRWLDATNSRGGLKMTEDCIVRSGLIQDDDPKHVAWVGDPEQRPRGQWRELDGPATYVWIRRDR